MNFKFIFMYQISTLTNFNFYIYFHNKWRELKGDDNRKEVFSAHMKDLASKIESEKSQSEIRNDENKKRKYDDNDSKNGVEKKRKTREHESQVENMLVEDDETQSKEHESVEDAEITLEDER